MSEFFIMIAAKLVQGFFGLPSWERADAWGVGLGRILWALGVRKKVILENMHQVYNSPETPDERRKTPEQIEALGRACMENFAVAVVTYIRWRKLDDQFYNERFEVEGAEYLDAAYAKGKGVLGIGGHLGAWELAMCKAGQLGYPVGLIGKTLNSPYLTRELDLFRTSNYMRNYAPKKSTESIMAALAKNEMVVAIHDQNMKRKLGVFVPFLGRPASTTKSTAQFVKQTGCAVVAGYARRIAPGRYWLIIKPGPDYVRCEDADEELLVNTKNYTQLIEDAILEKPEDWFWLHRRWKRRPSDEEAATLERLGWPVDVPSKLEE
ncbi:lysophospholipid acyltransferase family protein [bacterium]|nr:lysophospholipid acyltransferase family protein [bacterium]